MSLGKKKNKEEIHKEKKTIALMADSSMQKLTRVTARFFRSNNPIFIFIFISTFDFSIFFFNYSKNPAIYEEKKVNCTGEILYFISFLVNFPMPMSLFYSQRISKGEKDVILQFRSMKDGIVFLFYILWDIIIWFIHCFGLDSQNKKKSINKSMLFLTNRSAGSCVAALSINEDNLFIVQVGFLTPPNSNLLSP